MPPSRLTTTIVLALLSVGVLFAWMPSAHAAVPLTLPFQGRVLLKDGNVVPDGSYPAVFRLYRVESLGVPVWSESHDAVVASRGVVSVTLGLKTSLSGVDFSAGEYFLGVEFNNDGEMAPRARLTSVSSSLASLTLEGKRAADFLLKKGDQTLEGNLDLGSGNFTTNGNVSGGTFLQGGVAVDSLYLRLAGGTLTGDLTLQGSGTDLTVGGKSTFTGVATFKATPVFEAGITLGPQTVTNITATGTIESQGLLTAKNGFTLQAGTLSLPASSVTDAMVSDTLTASNYLALAGGTLTGTLRADSGIGIGLAASSTAGISILRTTQDSNYFGVFNTLADRKSGALAGTVYGLRNAVTTDFASGGTGAPTAYGVYTIATGESTGSILTGYYYRIDSSSTAGTYYAFSADMTAGTATKWGAYVQGATAGNWLGNALRIGGTAASPSGNLDVRQIANGDDVIFVKATGTSGNLITFQNAAGSSTLFSITNAGAVAGASYSGGTGAVTATSGSITTGSAVPLTLNNSTGTSNIFEARVSGSPVFSVLDGGNVQLDGGTLGGGAASTITIGRTSGSGNATVNLNSANATYTFKTNTRTISVLPRDCESSSGTPTSSSVGDFPSWLLDDSQSDTVRCSFRLPDDWSSGNLTVKAVFVGTSSTNSQFVVFQTQAVPTSERDDAAGSGQTDTDDFGLGSYTLNTRKTSGGVIVSASGSAIAAGDVVSLDVARLGSNVVDTYTGNVHLLMILINYTAKTPTSG